MITLRTALEIAGHEAVLSLLARASIHAGPDDSKRGVICHCFRPREPKESHQRFWKQTFDCLFAFARLPSGNCLANILWNFQSDQLTNFLYTRSIWPKLQKLKNLAIHCKQKYRRRHNLETVDGFRVRILPACFSKYYKCEFLTYHVILPIHRFFLYVDTRMTLICLAADQHPKLFWKFRKNTSNPTRRPHFQCSRLFFLQTKTQRFCRLSLSVLDFSFSMNTRKQLV